MPDPAADPKPGDPQRAVAGGGAPSAPGGTDAATGAAAASQPAQPAAAAGPMAGVWSRSDRKHRTRTALLLLVNLGLFCGLCIFSHWLHVVRPFDFTVDSYLKPLCFWSPQTQSLTDFMLYPISVEQTPIHGVVIGLLVAAIVAVPISVAILYGFSSALPFLAAVLVFAHMPWMAITLLGSCLLASVRPFRMSFRYGSALVGMLPVLVYLYLATRAPADTLTAGISPEERLLQVAPWLLAILAACTMLALVIFIARLVKYRPGAVAPVIAVMFATPAVLFYRYVGMDELTYRVLESRYGPRAECFTPVQDATEQIREYFHRRTQPGADPEAQRAVLLALWSASPEQQRAIKHRVSNDLLKELLRDRQAAYEECREFILDYPASRFVPCVLFMQARALDTRLDELKLVGAGAQRELYTDFPHVQSEPVWSNLLTQYPQSPLAVAARLRVAQLRLRRGAVDEALAVLTPVAPPAGPGTQPAPRPLLHMGPPEASLKFEPDPYLFEARRLRELILANRDDPRYGAAPLQALAALDPHRPGYGDQLAHLADQYRDGLLYDTLVVRWASDTHDREQRAARLLACIERFPAGDALPEAMFQLAELEMHAFGADESRRTAGLARLRDLAARFGQTCWGQLAAERLRMTESRTDSLTRRAVPP